jgi:hypothetical protein
MFWDRDGCVNVGRVSLVGVTGGAPSRLQPPMPRLWEAIARLSCIARRGIARDLKDARQLRPRQGVRRT